MTRRPTMVFAWRSEVAEDAFDVPAQDVGEALEAIRAENQGELYARDIVVVARSPRSPLHPLFEWDDRKAARMQREARAKQIVTAIVVKETPVDDASTARPYARVEKVAREGTLAFPRAVVTIAKEHGNEALLERALKELDAWCRRYGAVPELSPVSERIHRVIEEAHAHA